MGTSRKSQVRFCLIWVALAIAVIVPLAAAARNPLIAWRDPVYIVGGFAGIFAMVFLLLQPVLVAGYLPGFSRPYGRYLHHWIGGGLVLAVVIHVAALWITSPPDVIDALLFTSPTPFSAWGVVAMWAVFAAAVLGAFRRRLRLQLRSWRRLHTSFAGVVVAGSVVHAILIEGTMETISKIALCGLVILATLKALVDFRVWSKPKLLNKG